MPDAAPDLGAIRFRRHRDAGDVLNATVAFIRGNARELLRSYLAVVLPLALASGVASALYMSQVGDLFADPLAVEADPLGMFNVTYLGVLLFGLLGTGLTLAAAGAYVRLYREGRAGSVTAGELWEEAKGLIPAFIGLPLAYSFLLGLAFPILLLPCLGFVAWVALALWLLPRVAVTMAVRTLERPTLWGAWERAGGLVKGSWKFACGAIVLAVVVFYVVMLVAMVPLSIVGVLIGMGSTADPAASMTTMGAIFAPLQVISYAGYLIPLLATFFVHGRLVEEIEGTTLYGDLDALAGETGTATSDAFRSTPPAAKPPAEPDAPPPADDEPDADDRPSGFRGGGFST